MASLTNVVIAGGNAAAAVARVEMLNPAGYAGLAVSTGLDVAKYVGERQPDLVLFEDPFDDVDALEVASGLKRDDATLHIPIIMLNAPPAPAQRAEGFAAGFDDMLAAGAGDAVILARMGQLVRLSTLHGEFRHRVATAGEFGVAVDLEGLYDINTKDCRILLVGSDNDTVSALSSAIATTEFVFDLEPDPFKADARLAEETFDAVVFAVAEGEPMDNAYSLCAHIRNNPRLFNLPVLISSGNDVDALGAEPYRQGASMAVPLTTDIEVLTSGLRFLVRRQRLRWNLQGPITATLQSRSADSLNGVYSEEFARAHLTRLLKFGGRRRRNLSIALYSFQNIAALADQPAAAKQLMQQAADWISGLIRVEDMAARLGPNEICTILPGAAEREAFQATDRISGVLHNTDFQVSGTATRIWVQSAAATAVEGETADALIARAREALE